MTHLPASQRAASLPGAPFASARRSKPITQAVRTTLFCNRTHLGASLHKKWARGSRKIDRPRQPGNPRGIPVMRADRPHRPALLKLYGRCTARSCGRTSITRTGRIIPPISDIAFHITGGRQIISAARVQQPCPLPTPRNGALAAFWRHPTIQPHPGGHSVNTRLVAVWRTSWNFGDSRHERRCGTHRP